MKPIIMAKMILSWQDRNHPYKLHAYQEFFKTMFPENLRIGLTDRHTTYWAILYSKSVCLRCRSFWENTVAVRYGYHHVCGNCGYPENVNDLASIKNFPGNLIVNMETYMDSKFCLEVQSEIINRLKIA